MQLHSVEIIYSISILAAATFFSILVSTILVVIAPETFPARETFGVFSIMVVVVSVMVVAVMVVVVPVVGVLQEAVIVVVPVVVVPVVVVPAVVVLVLQESVLVVVSVVVVPIQLQHQTLPFLSHPPTWHTPLDPLTMKTSYFSIPLLVEQKWTLIIASH